MKEHVGQRFGNYRLLRVLGQGSFADVYLAEHIHLTSFAAIKILHTQLTSDMQENFLNEARILAQLSHPHIIRILDFGIEGGIPFLIMDHAPHGTLRQRHPRHSRLPLSTVVEYVKQITGGLQYAHDKKLIHRDLKPDNVLVGQRDELLISDFGVALIVRTTRSLHDAEDNFAGTAAYMAPEQLRGLPQFASDQYALGIMTYEWLCGTRPFQGSMVELYTQHLTATPPPLRQYMPLLPLEVEQVVLTALEKDPTRRFTNVKAFATALEQAYHVSQKAETVQTDATPITPSNPGYPTLPSAPSLPGSITSAPTTPRPQIATSPNPPQPADFSTQLALPSQNNDPTFPVSRAILFSATPTDPPSPPSDPEVTITSVNQSSGAIPGRQRSRSKGALLIGLVSLLVLGAISTAMFTLSNANKATSISTTPSVNTPVATSAVPVATPTTPLAPTPTPHPCLTAPVSSNPNYQGNGYAYSNGGAYHSASVYCNGKVYFAFTSAPSVADTEVRLCIAAGSCGDWVRYKAVKNKLLIMKDLPYGTSFHLQFRGYGASDSYQVKGRLYY